MDNNKEHIKQYTAADIKKYLKGQLSGAEMHAIEKAALDDPFLADAIEGMGYAMEYDDEEISGGLLEVQRKVQTRTTTTLVEAPVRSFRWWQVAAAAVVLVIAGLGVFYFMGSEKNMDVAKVETVQATDSVVPPKNVPDAFAEVSRDKDGVADSVSSITNKLSTPSKPKADEKFERDLTSTLSNTKEQPSLLPSPIVQQKPVDTLKYGYEVNPDLAQNKGSYYTKQKEAERAKRDSMEKRNMASIPAEVVKTKDELNVRTLKAKNENRGFLDNESKTQDAKLQGTVSGIVTDNNYNPQANALLRLDNSKGTYNTDNRGNFKIPAGDSAVNLSVTVIGYGTQNFTLSNNTFDNQLRLQPANNFNDNSRGLAADKQYMADSVANYRATGSLSKYKEYRASYPKAVIQDAEPVYGWLSYEQYLEKNKKVASNFNAVHAQVVVSFEVNKKGELSGFKIEQPISKEYNDEAIRLIKEGPAWKLLRGRKTRVTIIVRF